MDDQTKILIALGIFALLVLCLALPGGGDVE
jgi:hypothetical protein